MATSFLTRIPPTLAPALAAERGWSDAVVGYLASLNTLGAILFLALGAPFCAGWASVRACRRGSRLESSGSRCSATVRAGRRDGRLADRNGLWPLLAGGQRCPAQNRAAGPARHDLLDQAGRRADRRQHRRTQPASDRAALRLARLAARRGIFVLVVLLAVQPMRASLDAADARPALTMRTVLSPANFLAPLSALTASTSL